MAKRKTTKRKKVAMPQTVEGMLQLVYDHFDFGPTVNKQIETALGVGIDPLTRPPTSMPNYIPRDVREEKRGYGVTVIGLGRIDSWYATLVHEKIGLGRDVTVTLNIGCAHIRSSDRARERWANNVSTYSSERRPNRIAFIEWVERICKHRGWEW